MNQEKIGKFIAECRKERKLTQADLAEKLGVTEKSVSNWENGRNMPDLSLFKPLCGELKISINELMSGEKIKKTEYQDKLEENIVNTINYSNKKINKSNNIISLIIVIFGLFVAMSAIMIFPSESSWGSFYSVFGMMIFVVGISRITTSLKWYMRLLLIFVIFIGSMAILIFTDFVNVKWNNQAPMFRMSVTTYNNIIFYDTPFYDVYRCDVNSKNESWHIEKNRKYDVDVIRNYCISVKEDKLENMIKKTSKTSLIIFSKEVEKEFEEDKEYTNDLAGNKYDIIKTIDDEYDIKQILEVLSHAKYTELINDIKGPSYLFQLFDRDNNLIVEFKFNSINDGDEKIFIYFNDEDDLFLENYH